jgi:hypothetical protein
MLAMGKSALANAMLNAACVGTHYKAIDNFPIAWLSLGEWRGWSFVTKILVGAK